MKTRLSALLLSAGISLVPVVSSPAGEDGRVLLEKIMDSPGRWEQMCGTERPVPFDAPVRLFSSRLTKRRIFSLGDNEIHLLQTRRAELLPEFLHALQTMDMAKPPDLARKPGRLAERSGLKLTWLNSLHLEIIKVLNASDTLPDLLRLEDQLRVMLEASADPKSFLPPLYFDTHAHFEKPGVDPYESPDWQSPEYKRDSAIFTCRVYQRELLGTITLLLKQEDFAPAKTDFAALQKQEFEKRSATLKELIAAGEKAHAELEQKYSAAKADPAATEETKTKLYHDAGRQENRVDRAKDILKDLTADQRGTDFEAAYSAELRTKIRTMAESFLKTVPPEKRRGAASMPQYSALK